VYTEGHLLGDPLLRYNRNPNKLAEIADSLKEYAGESLNEVLLLVRKISGQTKKKVDPIVIIQKKLRSDPDRLKQVEEEVTKEIELIINEVMGIFAGGIKNA